MLQAPLCQVSFPPASWPLNPGCQAATLPTNSELRLWAWLSCPVPNVPLAQEEKHQKQDDINTSLFFFSSLVDWLRNSGVP